MIKNKKILLILIIVVASILRLYMIDRLPAINADEAAIGYNAYSLIQTGKDEHGNTWPIHFQSFNDYKPGLYFYLVLPFVKVFGLSVLSVRLPSVFLGILTVYLVYLLARELFKDNKDLSERMGLASALLLAINPWHIHFSRGGWEVNVATFFLVAGTYFFLKLTTFKVSTLFISMIFFVASLYTYHSARVIAPLLVIGLAAKFYKLLLKNYKQVLITVGFGCLLVLPLALDLVKPEIRSRAAGVGLFADAGPISRIEEQRSEHTNYLSFFPRLLHNKLINYGLAFGKNWTDHYWGEFLFLSGDKIERNRVPETGQFHMFELVTILVGLYFVARKPKGWGIVVFWVLIAPTAAALTFQSPHALRAQNLVIPLTLISGFGLVQISEIAKKYKFWTKFSYALVFVILAWSLGRYVDMYYHHMIKEYPYSSQYGVEELVNYVLDNENKYQRVVVTDRYDQPYILFLFYGSIKRPNATEFSPAYFQANHVITSRDKFGFSTVNNFGKYYFTSIKFDEARPDNPGALLVGTNGEIPDEANVLQDIYGVNGFKYFQVVGN